MRQRKFDIEETAVGYNLFYTCFYNSQMTQSIKNNIIRLLFGPRLCGTLPQSISTFVFVAATTREDVIKYCSLSSAITCKIYEHDYLENERNSQIDYVNCIRPSMITTFCKYSCQLVICE